VELVTDKAGYDLLINKMELPYTSVKTVLDDLNDFHEELFILGKIYAYSIQDRPFIHIDADVFIWDKFNDLLENAALICQSKEEGEFYNRYYSQIFYSMIKNFEFSPGYLETSIIRNKGISAVNAGIIGGNEFGFFTDYWNNALEFVERNSKHLHKIDVGYSNIVFEQFLFRALAEHKGLGIEYFSTNMNEFLSDITDMTGVPDKRQYIHLYAGHKKIDYLCNCLEYRLQHDYPKYYYKIINLLKTNQI
jgi:hypothetical protein